MGSVQWWGGSPPGTADATFLQGGKSGDIFVPQGSVQTFSSHLLGLHCCGADPSPPNSPAAQHGLGRKPTGLCQTLSQALDHSDYLHREALFGSAVVTEQTNGRKRSGKKLSLWQLGPYEQPLAHAWRLEEKPVGNQERCRATATRSDPEGSPKGCGCGSRALHLVMNAQALAYRIFLGGCLLIAF